jgi:hypothetical protein
MVGMIYVCVLEATIEMCVTAIMPVDAGPAKHHTVPKKSLVEVCLSKAKRGKFTQLTQYSDYIYDRSDPMHDRYPDVLRFAHSAFV